MQMSIQFAATELLDNIFQFLPRSSLLVCSSVCRNWQSSALRLFYETVELSEKTKEVWLHMAHQTEIARNIGIFVRKLTVNLAFSTTLSQTDFLRVISFVPFVKAIDLELSGYKLHYLSYLNKRSSDCITYLEDISTGDLFTDYQLQQYFLCAYSFRNSLKHLTLRNPYTAYHINGQSGTAISYLTSFTNLAHVSIVSDTQIGNNELENLLEAVRLCPKLVSFSYRNNCLLLLDQETLRPSESLKNKRLHNIELHVPCLTEYYIKNILIHFPTTLKHFTVNMTQTDYRDWIQEHNELFAIYLGLIKSWKFSISNDDKRRYSISRRVQVPKKLSKFWQFFRSSIRNRHLFTTMKFSFLKSEIKPDVIMERDENSMSLTYNSENLEDLYMNLEEFSPVYSSVFVSSCNTDPLINSVVINIPVHKVDELNSNRCEKIIQTLKSHSCRLQSLSIILENSVNAVENILVQLEYHPTQVLELPTTPNYALLKNIDFQVLSIQSIISTLPHLKALKLINCKPVWTNLNYLIDLTEIEHLCQLVLDLTFLTLEQRQTLISIQVEMSDNKVATLLYPCTKQTTPVRYSVEPISCKLEALPIILIKCQTIDEIICTYT
ncbi:hypothetical protein EDC94DRAFT_602354 [Helicostylum pulchrum]|nr:hypothetical protein EDC94DRAFT_602354 [Helicostylum pulchrum]